MPIPCTVAFIFCVWLFLGWSLRRKPTAADEAYTLRQNRTALERLAQVTSEHKEIRRKREAYFERKTKVEAESKRLAAEGAEGQQANKWLHCIKNTELQAELAINNVLSSLVDEVSDAPVAWRPGIRAEPNFEALWDSARGVLYERAVAELDSLSERTERARQAENSNPAAYPFSSGQRLSDLLSDEIKRVSRLSKQLDDRSVLALIRRTPPADDLASFYAARKRAKSLLRQIRRDQQGRVLRLIGFLSPSALGFLALSYVASTVNGFWGALHTTILSRVAATVSDPTRADWETHVLNDILGLGTIFVLEWWCSDFIAIISSNKVNSSFTHQLRNAVFRCIMRQDTVFFAKCDTSQIQQRLTHDTQQVCSKLLHLPKEIIGAVSRLIGQCLVVGSICPEVLTRTLTWAVIGCPVMVVMQRAVNTMARQSERELRISGRATDEMLRNIATVREFAREAQECEDFDRSARTRAHTSLKLDLIRHLQWPLFFTFVFAGQLASLHYAAGRVFDGQLTATDLVQMYGLVAGVTHICRHLMYLVPEFALVALPAERLCILLEARSLIEPNEDDPPKESFVRARTQQAGETDPIVKADTGGVGFELNNVTFAYPTVPEHTVLRKISMKIPAGKTVALVGERGCGKSTVTELLKRAYDPEPGGGEVLANGKPMQHWDVRSFRSSIAVVSQKVNLFAGTIRANILFGLDDEARRVRGFENRRDSSGEEPLRSVCELACAWSFISEFPLGLETRIGVGGVKLSGGQEQCIAIARALVTMPALLILDEATSALDAATQRKVAAHIAAEQNRTGMTIVQIAHRLETLTDSDIIFYFSHGSIVEVGGEETLNRSAVAELLQIPIVTKRVQDIEDPNKTTEVVTSGHFRQMWEHSHVTTDVGAQS